MKNKGRSSEPELLDLGPSYYTQEEYNECLYQLSRIGRFLGGNKATLKALKQIPAFESILDYGCGGGQFAMALGNRYPNAKVIGLDISSDAIAYAKMQLKKTSLQNVYFNQLVLPHFLSDVDVITTTLVCHHLSDNELVGFIKNACKAAKKAVIINDLHRHWIAYVGFGFISKFFFPNRLIYHDGLLSIKRAFKKKDWIHYLRRAGVPLERCRITWHWAFRWVIYIDTSQV